jgi:hypothetical protein
MTARELIPETATPETAAPEVIPPGPAEAEAAQKFSSEGELPAVAGAATAGGGATASELGFENKKSPSIDPSLMSDLDHGMTYWEHFKHECELAGKPELWKDEYVLGHTEAPEWSQPADHQASNDFRLKKGQSASDAIKHFIAGPTITDWHAAKVAIDIEDVRSEMGDQKFDRLFGSSKEHEDADVSKDLRLRITAADVVSSYVDNMRQAGVDYDAREAEPTRVEDVMATSEPPPDPKAAKPQVDELVAQQDLEINQDERDVV